MGKMVKTGTRLVLAGNIQFVKLLAEKYGNETPIGEIIKLEEHRNEEKQKK